MSYYSYILYSEKLRKYYVGSSEDVEKRIAAHNAGRSKFTKTGIPWKLVREEEHENRTEAVRREYQIKKRGAKRYLEDIASEGG